MTERNNMLMRGGGWKDDRHGHGRPSRLTPEKLADGHLEIIHPKSGVPECICTYCQTNEPIPTVEQLEQRFHNDPRRLVQELQSVRMHMAYGQAYEDITRRLSTTSNLAVYAKEGRDIASLNIER